MADYKIVIIGGGPGGYVAAIRAAQLGAKVALIEKDEVGGTCLNRGCIPTKALVAGVEVLSQVRKAAEFGIRTGEAEVDFSRLVERKNQVVNRLVAGVHFLLKKNKIELIHGIGKVLAPDLVEVTEPEGTIKKLRAENIVLATGSEPALLSSLGYDGERVITSNEALVLDKVPERLVIIGGGIIGCEFACIFSALGSQVTILEMLSNILAPVDQEAGRQMQGIFKRQGINIKTKARIVAVNKSSQAVTAVLESGEEVSADLILISIGRMMNIEGLGLDEVGVALGSKREVLVSEKMETSIPGIYAVGDITCKIQLAHVASAQGLVAVENIMGRPRAMDYQVVPNCIFTLPEVAGVGLTTQEAKEKGIPFKSGKFSFLASGKAQAMGETEGFIKVLIDPGTDKILGVHIVGPHATDLIAEAAVALQFGATVEQLTSIIHAHPTLAEAFVEAAEAVHGRSIHA